MAPVPALQVGGATNPDPTAPITPKTDLLHKAWVFTEIPPESLKYVLTLSYIMHASPNIY